MAIAGVPMMATNIATPIASAAWRIMLMTPEPVANEDGGSDDGPAPIRVGKVSPTPMPVRSCRPTATVMLGSSPERSAQHDHAGGKEHDAERDHRRRAEARDQPAGKQQRRHRHQERPGAMAMPVFSADQPQPVCTHSASDSSMAPKAAE